MWLKYKDISFPFVSESDASVLTELGDFSPCCKSICQVAAASLSDRVAVLENVDRVTYSLMKTVLTWNFSVAADSEHGYPTLRIPPESRTFQRTRPCRLVDLQVFVNTK